VLQYLALFLIVLLHEFGHALACRQVGGQANQILLWPFGGVAYVDPPQRPGATLWSIAAGPLVNVVLFPILLGLILLGRSLGWPDTMPDLYRLVTEILKIDVELLAFNILPIYPLDGGQILRSLLWFVLGRARSLMVATILGFVGIVGFLGLAFWNHTAWLGAIAIYLLMICWSGLQHARALLRFAKLPRRENFTCPACNAHPPIGDFWKCGKCGQAFDIFQTQGVCPNCATHFGLTKCLDCSAVHPLSEWFNPAMSVSSTFANEVRG
jgi:Zn-dependent protease